MRWARLFLLGLAAVYPLYWTAQFALFFLPASLRTIFFGSPVTIVKISFLQASALTGKSESLPPGFESLLFAIFISFVIWCLRGDKFLTGGLAIAILGRSAALLFMSQIFSSSKVESSSVFGLYVSMWLICFGLYRILSRTGGVDFVERLALLSLLTVLPQTLLWLAFRLNYPFFGTKSLLMMLAPLYLGAVIASALPKGLARNLSEVKRSPASTSEILASFAVACLLVAAIGLSSHSSDRQRPATASSNLETHRY